MRHQPFYLEILEDQTPTTLQTCGEKHLTILEAGRIPTFYLPISDLGPYQGSQLGFFLVDVDGNETILGQSNNFVGGSSTTGEFIITDEITDWSWSEGIYRIKIKVDSGDGDFLISDTYKFVDNPDDCYTRVEYWNDCSYYVPYERAPNFLYRFWLNKSAFLPDRLTNEEEFEELLDKSELSVQKVFERFEVLRMINLSTRTYESIVEGLTMTYFNIFDPNGSTLSDKPIIEKQIDEPDYDNEGCCIFFVDLSVKRERYINDDCCDGELTDCTDFDLLKVLSIENHLNFTNPLVNPSTLGYFGCYLSDFRDVVYCIDSLGEAYTRLPEHVYDLDQEQWYFYDENYANPYSGGTGGYVEFMNILSLTQTGPLAVDIELQMFKYQCYKIYQSWNGDPWELLVEGNSGGIEQDTPFVLNLDITPKVSVPLSGNNDVAIRIEYCNDGCSYIEDIDNITIFVP